MGSQRRSHFILFVECLELFTRSEEKRNAPYSRKCYHRINDAGKERVLTSTDPCDDVKAEYTDATPVECADYRDYQGNSIHNHFLFFLSATKAVFRSLLVLTPIRFLCKIYFGNSICLLFAFSGTINVQTKKFNLKNKE